MEWLRAAGPVVPGAARVPRAQPAAVRRADLLHVPVCADGARRCASRRTRASWCRRRTTSRPSTSDLPGPVQPAGRHRLQHRGRAALPHHALLDPRDRGGDGRLRRRPAAGAGLPARGRGAGGRRRRRQAAEEGRADDGSPTLPAAPGASAASMFRRRHRLHGPIRALRRPHRSGQGLRGADRVLQHLRRRRAATRRWC